MRALLPAPLCVTLTFSSHCDILLRGEISTQNNSGRATVNGNLFDALRDRAADYDVAMDELVDLERGEPMALATLRRGDQAQRYLAVLSQSMSVPDSYAQTDWPGTPLLVLGAKITPRNADRFRQLGINYLDANGNAYFTFGNVHIDVRGRTGDPIASLHQERPTTSNLFSPKRAQVIFALISWPELVNAKLQDIAHSANASVPFVQKTIADLEAANYVEVVAPGRQGRRLNNIEALIDGWVASFPGGLASPDNTRSFRGDFELTYLANEGPVVYVSGEAVADWIKRHTTWTLYCDVIPREAAVAGNWTARSSDPNIFIRPRFWNEPDGRPGHFAERTRNAPPLLVYADLMSSGESRQREAARHLRENNDRLRAP